jgi:hypothetical protein
MNEINAIFPRTYSREDIDFLMQKIDEQPDNDKIINLLGYFAI